MTGCAFTSEAPYRLGAELEVDLRGEDVWMPGRVRSVAPVGGGKFRVGVEFTPNDAEHDALARAFGRGVHRVAAEWADRLGRGSQLPSPAAQTSVGRPKELPRAA